MRRRNPTVRAIALVSAGSAAVHQLRYVIGYGSGASHALAAHPHGYLSVALPGIVTALVIGMVAVTMRALGMRGPVALGPATEPGSRPASAGAGPTLLRLWIASASALGLIFVIQETLEGAGALAHGGWIGLALAIPVGLVVALAMRGVEAAGSLRLRRPSLVGFAVAAVATRVAPIVLRPQLAAAPLGARAPPRPFAL